MLDVLDINFGWFVEVRIGFCEVLTAWCGCCVLNALWCIGILFCCCNLQRNLISKLKALNWKCWGLVRVGERCEVYRWVVLNSKYCSNDLKRLSLVVNRVCDTLVLLDRKCGFDLLSRLCFNEMICALVLNYILPTVLCMDSSVCYAVLFIQGWWWMHW